MNLNKEIVEGMYIALIFIAGYYLVKTKRINILWKILAAVNILSWACLLVILALDINVSADFISLNLAACEYSCAMKSHFRKFGNQMSGSGNHLYNYASLLA